jgi:hypothetical protein
VNQTNQRRPRTWVLRVVQAVFALTVLNVAIGAIASIWLGQFSGDSSWWLVMALPQVSVALLAVLACWDMAYSQFEEQGKVVINATLAYVWRVETEDDLSITRLWAMNDPTRILKAADDIHNLAVTLRLREDA